HAMRHFFPAAIEFAAKLRHQCSSALVVSFVKRTPHHQGNHPCHSGHRKHHCEHEYSHQFAAKVHCLPDNQTSCTSQVPSRPTDQFCTPALIPDTYRKCKRGITLRECKNV